MCECECEFEWMGVRGWGEREEIGGEGGRERGRVYKGIEG